MPYCFGKWGDPRRPSRCSVKAVSSTGWLQEAEEYLLEVHWSFLNSQENHPEGLIPNLEGLIGLYETLGLSDEVSRYRELLAQAKQRDR